MTASEVIEEIRRMPKDEQAKVLEFARRCSDQMLSPEELGALARRMGATEDRVEADRLEEEVVRGFYGHNESAAATAAR